MSEHSITELERQHDAALSKLNEAQLAYRAAKRRLHQAKCAATGLIGKRATARGVTIVVRDIEFSGAEPWRFVGPQIKQGGSVGSRERILYSHHSPSFDDAGAAA